MKTVAKIPEYSNDFKIDGLAKSRIIVQIRRLRKKLRRQGTLILRSEAYLGVRRNDEG